MKATIRRVLSGTALVVAGTLALGAVPAQAQSGSKIGILTCETVKGTRLNLIIRSTVDVQCVFDDGKSKEKYVGETGIGLGVDLNITKDAVMKYAVFAATDYKAGDFALKGRYGGGKAAATIGVGAGAAVLVGGGDDSISLQPVALEGSTGLGAEAGLTYLFIEPDV